MSQENVEIVRRVFEAAARRDSEAVLSFYDPEVEWDGSRLPEAALTGWSIARGHEGIRGVFREWGEAWSTVEDALEEVFEAGEHVVCVGTRRGRGRASGVEASTSRAGVWTFRDGKVLRVMWFPALEEALEAVGLRKEDLRPAG